MATITFNTYKRLAAILKQNTGIDYQTAKVDILANGYCDAFDAGDEYNKDLYIAALMLRFWYTIKKMADKSPNLNLDLNDFENWLFEAIEYACKYRAWRDATKKVNAQQAINQCIETIRLQHYYQLNLDKHKVNVNTISLENPVTSDSDDSRVISLGDTLADEGAAEDMKMTTGAYDARRFIQSFIDRQKLVEAIILDTIAFNDTQKEVKSTQIGQDEEGNEIKYSTTTYEFWKFKCIKNLANLPEDYADYFLENYEVKPEAFLAVLEKIRAANNQKLYKYLDKCLADCKTKLNLEGGLF